MDKPDLTPRLDAIVSLRLPEETRRKIEEGIRDWHDPSSPARKRFAECHLQFEAELQPLIDAIEATERLTERDFRRIIW